MANTRQYRVGMGTDRALAILREHAGSQWDPRVVGAFVDLITNDTPEIGRLEQVGRNRPHALVADCGCLDALPPQIAQLT
jgi:HD-GYP domain-containing protein (c-di-GMP phosphodiesterase class II)